MKRLSTQCMNEIENKNKQKPKRKENNAASANT